MIGIGPVAATTTDWLRLLAVPAIGWAAYRDLRIRRVPNRVWVPLALLAVALLVADVATAWGSDWRALAVPLAISVGIVVPLAYAFWYFGAFGGADAKALMLFALLYPTYPAYIVTAPTPGFPGVVPAVEAPLGVFSVTILTDAVIAGAAYPLGVFATNLVRGRIGRRSWMGRPLDRTAVVEAHGKLLETDDDGVRRGLDLDALRMYLRWRGVSLSALLSDPCRYRDRLPDDPNDPGDGAVDAYDEGVDLRDGSGEVEPAVADGDGEPSGREATDGGSTDGDRDGREDGAPAADDDREEGDRGAADADDQGERDDGPADADGDPWGAAAFLAAADGAYGTDPETLRGGLDILAEREEVWVTPGIPFMLPLFLGLVAALTVGDLLYAVLGLVAVGP